MQNLGLVEAWQLWLNGNSTVGTSLWSVSMVWWARIGKLLQFAGALTVVLDLVKADRLRRWGTRMRGNPFGGNVKDWAAESAPMQVIAFLLTIVIWAESAFGAQFAWVDRNLFGRLDRLPGWGGWLLIAFFAGLGVLVHKIPREHRGATVRLVRHLAVGVLWVGLAGLVLLLVLSFVRELGPFMIAFGVVFGVWWVLLLVMDVGFARPMAWVLDRDLPGQPVRWVGVALLMIGVPLRPARVLSRSKGPVPVCLRPCRPPTLRAFLDKSPSGARHDHNERIHESERRLLVVSGG